MANIDAPSGLKPVRYRSGAPYNGAATRYHVPSSEANNIFIGDLVSVTGTGGETDGRGVRPEVTQTAAGAAAIGVVVGFENLTSDNLSRTHRPASTAGYLLVADDPDLVFEVQEDSDGGALAATNIGQNADIVVGTGNTLTGTSAAQLDSSTAAGANGQLRIVNLSTRVGNEIGANAKWLVFINEHQYAAGAGV